MFRTRVAKPWTMAHRNRHNRIAPLSIPNWPQCEHQLAGTRAVEEPPANAIHWTHIHFLDQDNGWSQSSRQSLCYSDSERHRTVCVPLHGVTQRETLACDDRLPVTFRSSHQRRAKTMVREVGALVTSNGREGEIKTLPTNPSLRSVALLDPSGF